MESVDAYIAAAQTEQQPALRQLRQTIQNAIPSGFEEQIQYGMPSYVVPLSVYPPGYHCTPNTPLPFAGFSARKNFVGFHHMGMYADPKLTDWFQAEYAKRCKYKLDMGKSCVRFKKLNDIPYELIAELMGKMTTQAWIDLYEKNYKK